MDHFRSPHSKATHYQLMKNRALDKARQGLYDRRRVVGVEERDDGVVIVETESFDPQNPERGVAAVPFGMQCMTGDDVILVKFGGGNKWFVGWILRRGT